MDFEQALSAHIDWKAKLRTYLAKPDRGSAPSAIVQDGNCVLGDWIAAEGEKHSALREFQTLRMQYTRFRIAAADVVRLADLGQNVAEQPDLREEFSAASIAVVGAILALKEKVGKQTAKSTWKRGLIRRAFPI